jgi:hypothetical protein
VELPTDKESLIAVVRELVRCPPASETEMKAQALEAAKIAVHVQRNLNIYDVPEAIWHFLSDVDIRFKDPEYAAEQVSWVLAMLEAWTRGSSV